MLAIKGSRTAVLMLLMLVWSWSQIPQVSAAEDFDSLYRAITAANAGGESAITLTEDITLSGALPAITGSLTIDGGGRSISGDYKHRIFDVVGGRLAIKDLTLTRGRAPDEGHGGAIRLRSGAQVSIESSTITESKAFNGGAIATSSQGDSLTIIDSSFRMNSADEYAGGIYAVRGTTATISRSSFVSNRAENVGGAIHSYGRRLTISNSTFSANYAGAFGGAIDMGAGEVTLTHVTMVGNRNRTIRGGSQAIMRVGGRLYLRNSLIVGDGRGNCTGDLTESRGNLSTDGTCSENPSGAPLLEKLAGSPAYYALKDRSPAIDAADPEFCLETDQIGTARPQGGGCDVGAFETTTGVAAEPTPMPPLVCDLRHQIIAANTDAPSGKCPAGQGVDTISLDKDIKLFAELPPITSAIRIEGNGHSISGGDALRIFVVDGGNVTIDRLTLTEGATNRYDRYDLFESGGALLLQNGAQVTVDDSLFVNNSAVFGAAIGIKGRYSKLTIHNSVLRENNANSEGGAIFLENGTVLVANSSFINNTAPRGGAIHASSAGRLDVVNSSFIGNHAVMGGAVYTDGALTTLTHISVYVGGLWIADEGQTLNLRNSIVSSRDNIISCRGVLTQNVGNLISDGSCDPAYRGDPLFGERKGDPVYLPLQDGSPAIDAAHPAFCLATDQNGTPRPQGGGCDIGAIEWSVGGAAQTEASSDTLDLSSCNVTTTHVLNFRDGPGERRIGRVPENATMTAMARTPGWFQVEYRGATGWISADYVVSEGECG